MKIIHNIYSVGPGSFGLGPVALNLCRHQNALGHRAEIWCHDTPDDAKWAEMSGLLPLEVIRCFPCVGPVTLRYSPAMESAVVGAAGQNVDIIHQHCLWLANSRITQLLHSKYNVPAVIAPHGSLESWALQRSWWKKKLALFLYESGNLRNATCLHALSIQEVEGFRAFDLKNPIAVIPNGISQSWLESEGDATAFRQMFDIDPEKRIILFLSRITPIKGLPLLIEALDLIRKTLKNWVVVLAGADEFDHLREIHTAVSKHQLEKYVVFTGLLLDQTKRDAYAAAELFVLPTRREAAPVVVLEALGAGVPVITTKGAPWGNLKKYDCGWWVDIDPDAIADGLKDAMSRSQQDLKQMGQRGKELVASEYTWVKSAQMTIELYEWLLGRKERPEFVVVD